MKLSTRARYGARLMTVLAEHWGQGQVILRDIALQEDLSEKYLSLIVIPLRKAGLIQSTRGSQGGYTLARPPEAITMVEIVHALEGKTCLVDCINEPEECPHSSTCVTRDVWSMVGQRIDDVLESVTLASLVEESKRKNLKARRKSSQPVQEVTV